jgi:hypothetical protein
VWSCSSPAHTTPLRGEPSADCHASALDAGARGDPFDVTWSAWQVGARLNRPGQATMPDRRYVRSWCCSRPVRRLPGTIATAAIRIFSDPDRARRPAGLAPTPATTRIYQCGSLKLFLARFDELVRGRVRRGLARPGGGRARGAGRGGAAAGPDGELGEDLAEVALDGAALRESRAPISGLDRPFRAQ